MARETLIVGKIGPAFDGAFIAGHGSAVIKPPQIWDIETRRWMMDALWFSQASNIAEGLTNYCDVCAEHYPETTCLVDLVDLRYALSISDN